MEINKKEITTNEGIIIYDSSLTYEYLLQETKKLLNEFNDSKKFFWQKINLKKVKITELIRYDLFQLTQLNKYLEEYELYNVKIIGDHSKLNNTLFKCNLIFKFINSENIVTKICIRNICNIKQKLIDDELLNVFDLVPYNLEDLIRKNILSYKMSLSSYNDLDEL